MSTPRSLLLGAAALALASFPSIAHAGPGASGEAEASGSVSLGGGASADADGSASGSGKAVGRDKWIYRWAPQRNMAEIGVYGGVWFPSRHIELFEPTAGFPADGRQLLNLVAPEVGARAGYYPFRFFGVELEGGVMPTRTRASDGFALPWTVRGHIVGQLGLWSVTPFLLVGTGILGVASDPPPTAIGSEQDVAIHFGGGVKVYVNRWIQLRLDIRDVVSNRVGVGEGLTSSPEILLGVSVTLGRKKQQEERRKPTRGDRDGDGVLDEDDYCPDQFGNKPRGCPQVCVDDNDADGIENPKDQCPNEPESRNGFEDSDGCPDEVPPELADITGIMEGINFDTDKDTIKAGSKPVLDQAVEVMKKYPDIRVRITGHTDAVGPYRHNVDLSLRRAKSVKKYMVRKGGVDHERIEVEGKGPDVPIDTNDTVEGRARNRRIEFQVIEDDGSGSVSTTPARATGSGDGGGGSDGGGGAASGEQASGGGG